jgi:Ca2+-binding EF-hand superfamily protein
MIRNLLLVSSMLAAIALARPLHAADEKADSPSDDAQVQRSALFDSLDANHDGQITSDEVPDDQRRLFQRLLRRADANGDGKLSRDEFLAGMKEMQEQPRGPQRDEQPAKSGPAASEPAKDNQNSSVPGTPRARQFGNGPRPGAGFGGPGFGAGGGGGGMLMGIAVFRALDTNGDGKLDAKEIEAAPEALKKLAGSSGEITREELMKSMAGGAGGAFGPGGPGAVAAGGEFNPDAFLKQFISRMDKNGDGKLQKDELPQRMQERFDEMDTNHDGALDESELKAILPRLMRRYEEQQRGGGGGSPEARAQRRAARDKDKTSADADHKPASDSKPDAN